MLYLPSIIAFSTISRARQCPGKWLTGSKVHKKQPATDNLIAVTS